MADYIITLDDDQDASIGTPDYNIGVNYEIPSKSVQYQNLILDSIASQFDGTKTTFDLYVDGEPYTPVNAQGLIISINDVVLSPGVDYNVSGSQIIFTNPPAASSDFFGVALRTVADLTRTINFVLDNGSNDITSGVKGSLGLDVSGRIESWTLVSENEGSIVIDIKKDKYDTYPDSLTSIVGSEYPRLSTQKKNRDESLSTWTTDVVAGDILDFSVVSCTGIQKCSLFLRLIL
jgi:hypothetical protein|tara:strand:+ start:367 stop:1068 length:702 start_codon:yes stop_codon:yes gene_type:complete